jgi:hypothetical protein
MILDIPMPMSGATMQPLADLALTRLACKKRIVQELIERRVTLQEAAQRFAEQCPATNAADWETQCRTVIGWAHLMLSDRPELADTLSQSWEQELQNELTAAQDGHALSTS